MVERELFSFFHTKAEWGRWSVFLYGLHLSKEGDTEKWHSWAHTVYRTWALFDMMQLLLRIEFLGSLHSKLGSAPDVAQQIFQHHLSSVTTFFFFLVLFYLLKPSFITVTITYYSRHQEVMIPFLVLDCDITIRKFPVCSKIEAPIAETFIYLYYILFSVFFIFKYLIGFIL